MIAILHLILVTPLAGLAFTFLLPPKRESFISSVAISTIALNIVFLVVLLILWTTHSFTPLDVKELVLFKTKGYEYFISLHFDKITAVYATVGSMLAFLITVYSQAYLHREEGFKRFFNTILFFYLGYNIVIFSGNLETLFIGWEILGISSFLLIAFYRYRYLPVKNAVKVFSIYRVGDVGLLLAMWLSHHLWASNVTFQQFEDYDVVHRHLEGHTLVGIVVSLMILLTASVKSAQLPFSSWLPRAMEGPTPSSAIFYGALSVHIGIFLLMRTFHFWEHQISVRILIGLVGLLTSIATTMIARVQSSVKAQIAYSSISQIGLIFIEVALGWIDVALIHFAGNAFLRTYQLLVSPSVVTYLIREQFYNYKQRPHSFEESLPGKIASSLYVLSVKEFNLDAIMYRYLWNPLKWAGKKLTFLSVKRAFLFVLIAALAGLMILLYEESIPGAIRETLPVLYSVVGLIFVLKSFTERIHVRLSWILILMNHLCIALAVTLNERFQIAHTLWYLSGIVVFGIIGWGCLQWLKMIEKDVSLDRFHGHAHLYPGLSFAFLICCLSVVGFPITPTFIGEDLILSHIHENQIVLAFLVSLCFILDGLAIVRIYARVFLGPHVRSVYETGYRSS